MNKWRIFLMMAGALLLTKIASAQSFGESDVSSSQNGVILEEPTSLERNNVSTPKVSTSDEEISQALSEEKKALDQEKMMDQIFLPGGGLDVLARPTEDGSKRGGMAVVELNKEGRSRRAEKIFLYYDNFRMSSYLSNSAACDARFIVLTNLDRKLVSLDVKLVWPGMTTALSFSNVEPNTPTYLNYTLMGNGCYNMDQMPNIIVNRCRVRGMNSAECADKIVWLSAIQNK